MHITGDQPGVTQAGLEQSNWGGGRGWDSKLFLAERAKDTSEMEVEP